MEVIKGGKPAGGSGCQGPRGTPARSAGRPPRSSTSAVVGRHIHQVRRDAFLGREKQLDGGGDVFIEDVLPNGRQWENIERLHGAKKLRGLGKSGKASNRPAPPARRRRGAGPGKLEAGVRLHPAGPKAPTQRDHRREQQGRKQKRGNGHGASLSWGALGSCADFSPPFVGRATAD